jgi:flagellar biosynthesis protein FlgN
MKKHTPTESAFSGILNTEIEQAQRLLDLLEQEYQLLLSSPSTALETLLTEKKRLLRSVEQSVAAHHRFLQQQGFGADGQGTEAYLGASDGDPELTQTWRRYIELVEACRKQNEINGGAVALNQRQANQALHILLGISDGNKTYGRSGQSKPSNPSKSLGKA